MYESVFGEPLLSWFSSYLKDADGYQWVKVFGINSKLFLVLSKVPQWGHISPILFSLFINSVNRVLHHCRILCFADDINLYTQVNSIDDCHKLQADFDKFSVWFSTLGISHNIYKTTSVTSLLLLESNPQFFFIIYCLYKNNISRGHMIMPSLWSWLQV